jgi:hypothetical protein
LQIRETDKPADLRPRHDQSARTPIRIFDKGENARICTD